VRSRCSCGLCSFSIPRDCLFAGSVGSLAYYPADWPGVTNITRLMMLCLMADFSGAFLMIASDSVPLSVLVDGRDIVFIASAL